MPYQSGVVLHPGIPFIMGMNVLIVDDSKETRREIVQALRKDKSLESFFEASNGLEALRIISDEKVDLILTYLIMPNID